MKMMSPQLFAMIAFVSIHICNAARYTATNYDSTPRKVEYYRNYPISGSTDFIRAVIAIHQRDRNANDAFNSVVEAQNLFPGVGDETLVLAPWFKTEDDDPANDELFWSEDGWSKGDNSLDDANFSPFSAVDRLMVIISKRFPNVNDIVIAGHGMGGAFVHRYAGIGAQLDLRCDIRVRYVVSNAGSYVLPTSQRPSSTSGCDVTYDEYPYGISNVSAVLPYASSLSTSDIQQNLVSRNVFLLLGTGDNETLGNCETASQGQNRFERGMNYRDGIKSFDCGAHTTVTAVFDIGHDYNGMFTSVQGVSSLFIG